MNCVLLKKLFFIDLKRISIKCYTLNILNEFEKRVVVPPLIPRNLKQGLDQNQTKKEPRP